MVVVDYFLCWIEVASIRSTTAANFNQSYQVYCLPFWNARGFISDNGFQYKSSEFARFVNELSIIHVTFSPRYP